MVLLVYYLFPPHSSFLLFQNSPTILLSTRISLFVAVSPIIKVFVFYYATQPGL